MVPGSYAESFAKDLGLRWKLRQQRASLHHRSAC